MQLDDCYYLIFDPGVTTGWAAFSKEGRLLQTGMVKQEGLLDVFKSTLPSIVVYESFELRKGKAIQQAGSDMPASKVIGRIEAICDIYGTPYKKQRAWCKESGYKWAGIPKATNHKYSHDKDAYAHGVYYLIQNKIVKPTFFMPKEL